MPKLNSWSHHRLADSTFSEVMIFLLRPGIMWAEWLSAGQNESERETEQRSLKHSDETSAGITSDTNRRLKLGHCWVVQQHWGESDKIWNDTILASRLEIKLDTRIAFLLIREIALGWSFRQVINLNTDFILSWFRLRSPTSVVRHIQPLQFSSESQSMISLIKRYKLFISGKKRSTPHTRACSRHAIL